MNGQQANKRPHGKIRRSQVITTFGPGAMLDLPKYSVLVGGLDGWKFADQDEIREPRLIEKLKGILKINHLQLKAPPANLDDPTLPQTGIGVWQFPQWFVTEVVPIPDQPPTVRSRMLVHRKQLGGKAYFEYREGPKPKKLSIVPVRFVRACPNGHIADIDWHFFAHSGGIECKRQLWIDETGTSADLSELFIWCECRRSPARCMTDAAMKELHALGKCSGWQPWLGPDSYAANCAEYSRLLIRTASNSYFPQLLSVISLPEKDDELINKVGHVWTFLQHVQDISTLESVRGIFPPVKAALEGFANDKILEEIKRRRGENTPSPKGVKYAEFETLSAARDEIGEDKPDGDFHARTLPKSVWNITGASPWMNNIERIVLVHRLREVVAQVGFTRFEAASPDVTGELDINVQSAPLANEITWVPALENKGEGIFIQFNKQAVETWWAKSQVRQRELSLKNGFDAWLKERPTSTRKFPGIRYVMLHSFSHLLITAIALECGYPASSIRERVYALDDAGYGILLFTGTSDAEGTLGGLIEVGRKVHHHVRAALQMAELCSNDPVCAEHEPKDEHERRFLHGAACHGCLLIAETSCEYHNDFLDRSLVVSTVENSGVEFFDLNGIG